MAQARMSLSDNYWNTLANLIINGAAQWGQNTADNQVNGEAKKIKDQVGLDGSGATSTSQTVNNGDGTSTTTTQTTQPNNGFYGQQIGNVNPLANKGYGSLYRGSTVFNPGDKYNSGIANLKNQYALAQNTYNMSNDPAEKQAALNRMYQYNAQADALRKEAAENGVALADAFKTSSSGNMQDYMAEKAGLPQAYNQNYMANFNNSTGNYALDKLNGLGLFATGNTPINGNISGLYNQSAAAGNPQVTANNPVSTTAPTVDTSAPTQTANPTAAVTANQAVGNPYNFNVGLNLNPLQNQNLTAGKLLGF